jgi:O-antigen/teichoic acid export membrane protein
VGIILLAAAVNFCLNLALIPIYRQNGAAGATLISEVLVLFLMLRAMSWRQVRGLELGRVTLRPLLAGLLSFGLARGLVAWHINFLAGLALMVLGFFGFMVCTGALSREELRAAWELITGKRKELEAA